MTKRKKKSGPAPKRSKIEGDPKGGQEKLLGKRPTSERPPAPRVPPKRRER